MQWGHFVGAGDEIGNVIGPVGRTQRGVPAGAGDLEGDPGDAAQAADVAGEFVFLCRTQSEGVQGQDGEGNRDEVLCAAGMSSSPYFSTVISAIQGCRSGCTAEAAPGIMELLTSSSGRGSAWLERLVRDQEAGGSNPLAPTKLFKHLQTF